MKFYLRTLWAEYYPGRSGRSKKTGSSAVSLYN